MNPGLKKKITTLLIAISFFLCLLNFNSKFDLECKSAEGKEIGLNDLEDISTPSYSGTPPSIWDYQINNDCFGLSMAPDGSFIAVIEDGFGGDLYLFKKNSSTPIWIYETNDKHLESIAVSTNGNFIVLGHTSGVYLFDNTSNNPIWGKTGPGQVLSIAITPDGKYFALGTNKGVYLFNTSDSNWMWKFDTFDYVWEVDISEDGKYIAAAFKNGSVFLFNRTSNKPIWKYDTGEEVVSIAISADGKYVVAGNDYLDDDVYLFNATKTNDPFMWSANMAFLCDGEHVDISSDGSYITATGANIYVFQRDSSIPIINYSAGTMVNFVAISSDGRYISAGDNHEYLYIFDRTKSSSPIITYNPTEEPGYGSMSSDGKYIATGSWTNDIYLYYGAYTPGNLTLDSNAGNPDRDGTFDLMWNKSAGAYEYSIYMDDTYITKIDGNQDLIAQNVQQLTYPISDLAKGEYYFLVVSENDYGNNTSNCIKVEVKIPPGPFTLDADADDPDMDGNFNLTWSKSARADNYSVYSHDVYIHQIKNNGTLEDQGIEKLNYTISGLTSGDYYYMVIAFNETGNTSSNCHQVSVRIPPKAFFMFTDADDPDTDGTFNLTWTQSFGADNYSVYRSNKSISNLNDCIEVKSNITDLNYTVVGMNTGTYYFVIVAYNATGFTLSDYVQVNVSIPVSLLPPIPDDDDDDDGDKEPSISFGLYFVPFIAISILIIIIYMKRKLTNY